MPKTQKRRKQGVLKKRVVVGFGPHDTEMIGRKRKAHKFIPGPMLKEMEKAEYIDLEESPEKDFKKMLKGKISIKRYMQHANYLYEDFTKAQLEQLKKLYKKGKRIQQGEDRSKLSEKENASRLSAISKQEAHEEKQLEYTKNHNFIGYVKEIKHYEKASAKECKLRDEARFRTLKEEIPKKLKRGETYFVEAGQVHTPLYHRLKKALEKQGIKVESEYLARPALHEIYGKASGNPSRKKRTRLLVIHTPGEQLNRVYQFGRKIKSEKENLLAARKALLEMLEFPEKGKLPYRNRLYSEIKFVNSLTYLECEKLWHVLLDNPKQAKSSRKLKAILET